MKTARATNELDSNSLDTILLFAFSESNIEMVRYLIESEEFLNMGEYNRKHLIQQGLKISANQTDMVLFYYLLSSVELDYKYYKEVYDFILKEQRKKITEGKDSSDLKLIEMVDILSDRMDDARIKEDL